MNDLKHMLADQRIKCLSRPSQSPDLNPTEKLCELKRREGLGPLVFWRDLAKTNGLRRPASKMF